VNKRPIGKSRENWARPIEGSNEPSNRYVLIWQAIRSGEQIACTYKGQSRMASPVILGYSRDGQEIALVYQFGGQTSGGGKLPQWRNFYLAGLSDLTSHKGRRYEGGSHKQPQATIQFVDVDVNIPETLTRARPLPFGSNDLLPPRRST
jgi:hypothetical protein